MATATFAAFLAVALLLCTTPTALGGPYDTWTGSSATFYGGSDAGGTMGGACGYGNLYSTGYGTNTAAASITLFSGGAECGACYQVQCTTGKWCRPGASTFVTITNLCPQGSEGGGCDAPRKHLDMSLPAWRKIGANPVAGVLETRMRRVPCRRRGGVGFTLSGNPYWLQLMIFNVAGPGDLQRVEVSADRGRSWRAVSRNWGSVYSVDGHFSGKALSFRLTGRHVPQRLTLINAVPASWSFGGTYYSKRNFWTPRTGAGPNRARKGSRKTLEVSKRFLRGVGGWFSVNVTAAQLSDIW